MRPTRRIPRVSDFSIPSATKRLRTVGDDSVETVLEICCFSEMPRLEEDGNDSMSSGEPQNESAESR